MILSSNNGLIGVDIGTHSIKLAQVKRSGRRLELRAAAVLHRENRLRTDDWLRSAPVSSASEIRSARVARPFRGWQAACTSPIAVCDVRDMQVPDGPDSDQRTHIQKQLAEIHNIRLADISFDFWRDDSRSGDQGATEMHVLCMGRNWTGQLIDDHKQARLSCRIIDGTPQALARAVSLLDSRSASEPVAVIDWGGSSVTFVIVLNWQPVFVRCLTQNGFQTITDKLVSTLGLPEKSVARMIRKFGVGSGDSNNDRSTGTHDHDSGRIAGDVASDDEIRQVIEEIAGKELGQLAEEIRRTIAWLKSQKRQLVPKTGYLLGAGATLKHLDRWLTRQLDMPWQEWSIASGELAGKNRDQDQIPAAVLGQAIALSCLAWPTARNLLLPGRRGGGS